MPTEKGIAASCTAVLLKAQAILAARDSRPARTEGPHDTAALTEYKARVPCGSALPRVSRARGVPALPKSC